MHSVMESNSTLHVLTFKPGKACKVQACRYMYMYITSTPTLAFTLLVLEDLEPIRGVKIHLASIHFRLIGMHGENNIRKTTKVTLTCSKKYYQEDMHAYTHLCKETKYIYQVTIHHAVHACRKDK